MSSATTAKENALIRKRMDALERAERRLIRAQNAWQKARADMARLDKRLSKKIGGQLDVREIADDITGVFQA